MDQGAVRFIVEEVRQVGSDFFGAGHFTTTHAKDGRLNRM
jgi:thiamine monophosphate synthase